MGDSFEVQEKQVIQAEEISLSGQMTRAWHAIAATGSPPADLQWPRYTNSTQPWLVWNSADQGGTRVIRNLHTKQCDWWDRYIPLAPTG